MRVLRSTAFDPPSKQKLPTFSEKWASDDVYAAEQKL
jgi:hypothetical protein